MNNPNMNQATKRLATFKPRLTPLELAEQLMEIEMFAKLHHVECGNCGLWGPERKKCKRCGQKNKYSDEDFKDFVI